MKYSPSLSLSRAIYLQFLHRSRGGEGLVSLSGNIIVVIARHHRFVLVLDTELLL